MLDTSVYSRRVKGMLLDVQIHTPKLRMASSRMYAICRLAAVCIVV